MRIRDDKLDALLRPWMTEALKECDVNRFEFKGGEDYSGDEAVFVNIYLNENGRSIPLDIDSKILSFLYDILSEYDDERYVYVKSYYLGEPPKISQEKFRKTIQNVIAEVKKNEAAFHAIP